VSCSKCINQVATKVPFRHATAKATIIERLGGKPRYDTPTVTKVKKIKALKTFK
jgi:hypothetical protein